MGKLTVAEAAQHFNVSKEAIHNRIRRGTIDCIIENGVKYVVIGEPTVGKSSDDSRYYDYIEKENERLKARVNELEGETRNLRDQREQMLIEERKKIEQIYKERDEQLRNVLQVVASKFLPAAAMESVIEEAVTAEVIEEPKKDEGALISLKAFLKLKKYKEKEKTKIKSRFKKRAAKDSRIVEKEGKLFLDPSRFDYSDLLKV
ncbi:MAG: DNA-binding protein [Sulfurimonadaceae bacterium]|nr:DNA-binding protein [Sulfurimonadaceae bacterium]